MNLHLVVLAFLLVFCFAAQAAPIPSGLPVHPAAYPHASNGSNENDNDNNNNNDNNDMRHVQTSSSSPRAFPSTPSSSSSPSKSATGPDHKRLHRRSIKGQIGLAIGLLGLAGNIGWGWIAWKSLQDNKKQYEEAKRHARLRPLKPGEVYCSFSDEPSKAGSKRICAKVTDGSTSAGGTAPAGEVETEPREVTEPGSGRERGASPEPVRGGEPAVARLQRRAFAEGVQVVRDVFQRSRARVADMLGSRAGAVSTAGGEIGVSKSPSAGDVAGEAANRPKAAAAAQTTRTRIDDTAAPTSPHDVARHRQHTPNGDAHGEETFHSAPASPLRTLDTESDAAHEITAPSERSSPARDARVQEPSIGVRPEAADTSAEHDRKIDTAKVESKEKKDWLSTENIAFALGIINSLGTIPGLIMTLYNAENYRGNPKVD